MINGEFFFWTIVGLCAISVIAIVVAGILTLAGVL